MAAAWFSLAERMQGGRGYLKNPEWQNCEDQLPWEEQWPCFRHRQPLGDSEVRSQRYISSYLPLVAPCLQTGGPGASVYNSGRSKRQVEKGGKYVWRDKGRSPAWWETIFVMIVLLRILPPSYFSSSTTLAYESCYLSLYHFLHIHHLTFTPNALLRIISGKNLLKTSSGNQFKMA
jgi:hypothetical protein